MDFLKSKNIDVEENSILGGGGAIMNYGIIEKLSGVFLNNSTDGHGGAIRNYYGTINIVSDEQPVYFSGNTDCTGSNAIYSDSGIVNMNADKYDIVFDDAISGSGDYVEPVININQSGNAQGKVVFNNTVSDNMVNMYAGVLQFGEYNGASGNFTDKTDFNFYGGTVDLRSSQIRNTNLGNLVLYSDMELKLDGNFADLVVDTISANSFVSNGHNINISDILLNAATDRKKFAVSPFGADMDENTLNSLKSSVVYTAGDVVNSPIYRYKTYYDSETGLINFERINNPEKKFNPAVLSPAVAAQLGGYLTELNTYYEVFRRMNSYMFLTPVQRQALKQKNRYALCGNYCLCYEGISSNNSYGWISPYTIFENVPLKNGTRVSNVSWGTLAGVESAMFELGRDWDVVECLYAGYNGSHQAYNGIGINQNGGLVGLLAMAYRGNFFVGATANVGANGAQADTMYGTDDFSMIMSGVAAYCGYNFMFKNSRFIIQPNYLMSYTFVNTFSFTNEAGVKINTRALNAIEVAPGIQFIGNLKNGWQPYIGVNMVWNIIDKARFKANDVSLPNLSVKPFVMYGVGVRKVCAERFSGFFQAYVTNAGRNGIGMQLGFRWNF